MTSEPFLSLNGLIVAAVVITILAGVRVVILVCVAVFVVKFSSINHSLYLTYTVGCQYCHQLKLRFRWTVLGSGVKILLDDAVNLFFDPALLTLAS